MSAPARDAIGRFATKECPRVYALLDSLAPSMRPEGGFAVHAPKCPHGHFERWARRNCKSCLRSR